MRTASANWTTRRKSARWCKSLVMVVTIADGCVCELVVKESVPGVSLL
jgi:hypothetical protein